MSTLTRRLLLALSLGLVLYVGVFTLAMVSQLADGADRLHPGLGQPLFWSLLSVMALAVLIPSALLLRLPAALRYPDPQDLAAVAAYQLRLRAHLAQRPQLAGQALTTQANLVKALALLQEAAEQEIRRTAASVLVSTALLQNGRLDGLVILASQIRLVWRVARIYGLRPSLRQMTYLYSQVGACMLIAGGLEEIDFAELSSPVVQAATPAALASLPGLGGVGNLLVNSLASGSANAFLTLRVGLVAQAYCAPLQQPERDAVRRSASLRAAGLLGAIVKSCGSQLSQAVYGRLKNGVAQTAQAAVDGVKQAGHSVSQATRQAVQASGDRLGQTADQVRSSSAAAAQGTTEALQNTVSRLQAAVESLTTKNDRPKT